MYAECTISAQANAHLHEHLHGGADAAGLLELQCIRSVLVPKGEDAAWRHHVCHTLLQLAAVQPCVGICKDIRCSTRLQSPPSGQMHEHRIHTDFTRVSSKSGGRWLTAEQVVLFSHQGCAEDAPRPPLKLGVLFRHCGCTFYISEWIQQFCFWFRSRIAVQESTEAKGHQRADLSGCLHLPHCQQCTDPARDMI